jgi:hypothetical protein
MLEYRHSLRDDEVRYIKNIVDRFQEKEQRRKEEAQKDNLGQS